jgi:hypothetical protein
MLVCAGSETRKIGICFLGFFRDFFSEKAFFL